MPTASIPVDDVVVVSTSELFRPGRIFHPRVRVRCSACKGEVDPTTPRSFELVRVHASAEASVVVCRACAAETPR